MGGFEATAVLKPEMLEVSKEFSEAYDAVVRAFDNEIAELKKQRFMLRAVRRLEGYKAQFINVSDTDVPHETLNKLYQAICREHKRAIALQVALVVFSVLAMLAGAALLFAAPHITIPVIVHLAVTGFFGFMTVGLAFSLGWTDERTKTKSFDKLSTSLSTFFKKTGVEETNTDKNTSVKPTPISGVKTK